MKELIYGRKKIVVPEGWNELTAEQFIAAVDILHRPAMQAIENGNVPVGIFDRMMFALSGKSLFTYWRLPYDMRVRCFDHVMWVFEEQKITIQLLPKYKGLWGPMGEFANLLMSEFHHSEISFCNYVTKQDLDALNELVAILYRRAKFWYNKKVNKDGDVRRPFNYAEVQHNIKRVAKWPLAVKQAIALWYACCKQALIDQYRPAFDSNDKNTAHDVQGMYKLIRAMSGDKYGTFDKVEGLNIHLAFLELVQCKLEYEEMKRKHPELYQ